MITFVRYDNSFEVILKVYWTNEEGKGKLCICQFFSLDFANSKKVDISKATQAKPELKPSMDFEC